MRLHDRFNWSGQSGHGGTVRRHVMDTICKLCTCHSKSTESITETSWLPWARRVPKQYLSDLEVNGCYMEIRYHNIQYLYILYIFTTSNYQDPQPIDGSKQRISKLNDFGHAETAPSSLHLLHDNVLCCIERWPIWLLKDLCRVQYWRFHSQRKTPT